MVSQFIRKRKNDRIGLIVFGQAACPVTPFTLDHDACLKILSQTDAGMAGPQTIIGDAIGLAIKQFKEDESRQRVLIPEMLALSIDPPLSGGDNALRQQIARKRQSLMDFYTAGIAAYHGDREAWSQAEQRVMSEDGNNPYYLWVAGDSR